jgi:predicted transcriptional regulator
MPQTGLLSLTAQIVIAHIQHNDTTPSGLPGLIRAVYEALVSAAAPPDQTNVRPAAVRKTPSGQTVFDDYLICMECGLHMKMLKRHLLTVHNTTPSQYRTEWRLPVDYPMVARQYAALRSSLAKDSGLGKRPMPRGK